MTYEEIKAKAHARLGQTVVSNLAAGVFPNGSTNLYLFTWDDEESDLAWELVIESPYKKSRLRGTKLIPDVIVPTDHIATQLTRTIASMLI